MNDNDYQPLDLDEEDYGTCDTCIYADVTADLEPCASCDFMGMSIADAREKAKEIYE